MRSLRNIKVPGPKARRQQLVIAIGIARTPSRGGVPSGPEIEDRGKKRDVDAAKTLKEAFVASPPGMTGRRRGL
jgi:hypothetical protein